MLGVAIVTVVAIGLGGCSTTTTDKSADWSPNKLYAEAKDELNSGAYDKAVTLLEKL
ncbi:MAG: outer membrane protein assembly factor BamD, partial [Burkholderiaceae bacterium]